jgi:hypothetical protein
LYATYSLYPIIAPRWAWSLRLGIFSPSLQVRSGYLDPALRVQITLGIEELSANPPVKRYP